MKTFLKSLFSGSKAGARRPMAARPGRRARLGVESLERRELMSVSPVLGAVAPPLASAQVASVNANLIRPPLDPGVTIYLITNLTGESFNISGHTMKIQSMSFTATRYTYSITGTIDGSTFSGTVNWQAGATLGQGKLNFNAQWTDNSGQFDTLQGTISSPSGNFHDGHLKFTDGVLTLGSHVSTFVSGYQIP